MPANMTAAELNEYRGQYEAFLARHRDDNPQGDTLSFDDWLEGELWLREGREAAAVEAVQSKPAATDDEFPW